MIAMNSQAGMPHNSTLRNPGLNTASVMIPSKNNQTMYDSLMCEQQPTAVRPLDSKSSGSQKAFLSMDIRLRQQCFNRPPSFVAVIENLIANAKHCGPLLQCSRLSAICDFFASTLIVRLFCSGCPDAVVFAIWSIVILAFYGQVLGSLSHVSKEIVKGEPSLTNRDASTAVMLVSGRFRIVATLQYVRPYHVSGCSRHAVFFWRYILTATRFGSAVSQAAGQHGFLRTTRASAEPSLHVRDDTNGGPFAKLFSWLNRYIWSARQTAGLVSNICFGHALYNIETAT